MYNYAASKSPQVIGGVKQFKKKPKNKPHEEGKHKHHRGNTKLNINHQCEWR